MGGTVKISVGYKPLNERNFFVSGDYISGEIALDLAKKCKIKSFIVKLKGGAEVEILESSGQSVTAYRDQNEYFNIEQEVIQVTQGNNTIEKGHHVYPFTFQIPVQDLPSSFKGKFGKIRYTLEANLSRSMGKDSKAKTEFTLLYNGNLNRDASLKVPQQQATNKTLKRFAVGTVEMDVNIARTGFYQGEGIQVVASIQNRSSREIRPKYRLYKKCSYSAGFQDRWIKKDVLKEVGEPIPPFTNQSVTRTITIPPETSASILNCSIIGVDYWLKVYLTVKFASDPKIKFPITILPVLPETNGEEQDFYPVHRFGANGRLELQQAPPISDPSATPPTVGEHQIYRAFDSFDI